jgi:hypothetical protein
MPYWGRLDWHHEQRYDMVRVILTGDYMLYGQTPPKDEQK